MRKKTSTFGKIKTKKSLNSKLFNDNHKSSNIKSNSTDKNLSKKLNISDDDVSYYLNRIDDYTGFFTTQQINNIDFSKFENHVFFDSAVDKVNYSFKKILNEFPYDGTELEFDQFTKNLDGYTSYLLKKVLPKNIGYINLNGQYKVEVKDKSGFVFKNPINDKKGHGYLDPKLNSFTFDFWINPRSTNQNQIVFQKISGSFGYTVYLDGYDHSDNTIRINSIYQTDSGYIYSFCKINYEAWNHVNINIHKERNKRTFVFYVNGAEKISQTEGNISLSQTTREFKNASLVIGHGVDHPGRVSNINSFIGYIDNFRVFNRKLSKKELLEYKENDIYSTNYCVLNLTFNEPHGSYTNNNIVLDRSGKKLDGIIKHTNSGNNVNYNEVYDNQIRIGKTASDLHIRYEKENNYPVRFPSYQENINTQIELIGKGVRYDKINPNIFYKLFPKNLFLMSASFENKEEIYIDNSNYKANENNTEIITPESTALIQILSIWSRFFDQLKMYIDSFDEMINLDYDSINKEDILGMFLPTIVKKMGFEFKELLPSSLKTKLDNKNLTHEEIYSDTSIRHIQNELWKRFLINSKDFLRAKGTKKSINTVFNSMGIDANKFISIREFNGKNILNTKSNYNEYLQKFNYINFGIEKNISLINPASYLNKQTSRYPNNKFILEIGGFTKNSDIFDENWSIEFFVKYNRNLKDVIDNQSLIRLERNSNRGSSDFPKNRPLINVRFEKSTKRIVLDIEEGESPNNIEDYLRRSLTIENIDLLSGSNFYFCVSRKVIENTKIIYRFNVYESNYPYSNTKSHMVETEFLSIESTNKEGRNLHKEITSNISSLVTGEINPETIFYDQARPKIDTKFEGKIHSLKIWKKYISEKEINSHKTDIRNFGLQNPSELFDQTSLILDLDLRQQFKIRDSNEYMPEFDLSGNSFYLNNSSEKLNTVSATLPDEIYLKARIKSDAILSTLYDDLSQIMNSESIVTKKANIKIDEPVIFNGININYFEDTEYNNIFGLTNKEKRFELDSNFEIYNDIRCSIDFSNVNFLNKEISNLISYNDFINDELSKSFSKYDDTYTNINYFKEKFFGLLKEEINFKPLYQIYKYFDNIMSDLLYQTIPSRVNYLGFNFVYESHALERHKYNYKMSENRLPVVENHLDITSNEHKTNSNLGLKYRNNVSSNTITTHIFQS